MSEELVSWRKAILEEKHLEEILSEARKKAEEILSEARKKAEEILSKENIKERAKQIIENKKKEIAEEARKKLELKKVLATIPSKVKTEDIHDVVEEIVKEVVGIVAD